MMGAAGRVAGMVAAGRGVDFEETLLEWDPAQYSYQMQNVLTAGGDFTLGTVFAPGRTGLKVAGVRVHVDTGQSPQTVRVSLWGRAGAPRLAVADATLTGVGVHDVRFSVPYNLDGDAENEYVVSIWRNDAALNTRFGDPAKLPAAPVMAGAIVFTALNWFVAGDGKPTDAGTPNRYPVSPLLEV